MSMRGLVNRYESEIRFGLVTIVLLLLLLNLSSTYILQRVKQQVREEIDQRLGAALDYALLFLSKNDTTVIPPEELSQILHRYGLSGVQIVPCDRARGTAGDLSALLPIGSGDRSHSQYLYHPGFSPGERLGKVLWRLRPDQSIVIVVKADSKGLATITTAARTTLYMAMAILVIIIPLTIFLPRFILRPFREMQETARSAGRLDASSGGDEVAAVTRSYEAVIRELKAGEAELKRLYRESSSKADRLEKFNRHILKSIGTGVITVDLGGKVVGFNRAAGDILGCPMGDIIGRHYLTALPEALALGLLIEAGLNRGETVSLRDVEIALDNSSSLWLAVQTSLTTDDDEHAIGVTLLFTDLTESRRLEQELEMNRRMAALGEMTAGLAHQLRNSLAAVSGFSQLLIRKTESEAALADIAQSIRSEVVVASSMVSRFLNFARPLELNCESINLGEVLDYCVARVERQAGEKNVRVDYAPPVSALTVSGDPLLLRETFGNLLDNALQAVGREGGVTVRTATLGRTVEITVSDTGPGIPQHLRTKLFTPFVSSKPSGTGLGLALAHKIISLHGGTIAFEPDCGRGAVCRVVLPLIAGEMQFPVTPTSSIAK